MKKILVFSIFVILGVGLLIRLLTTQPNQVTTLSDIPSPTQHPELNVPEDWQVYADEALEYTIAYPASYALEPNGESSIMLIKPSDEPGAGPSNFIYISVVTPDNKEKIGEVYNYDPKQFEKLIALENVGDSVNLAEGDVPNLGE